MAERGVTQQALANAVGVSQAAVAKWLKGSIPGAGELFRVASAFDLRMDDFFDAIPDKPASDEEKAKLLGQPHEIPAEVIRDAARPLGLQGAADISILLDHALNYEQIWEPTGNGGWRMYYKKKEVDVVTQCGNMPGVYLTLDDLINKLRAITKKPGYKAKLARYLGVKAPRITEWLKGIRRPGGKYALLMSQWAEDPEKENKSTQEKPQNQNEKPKSSLPKTTQKSKDRNPAEGPPDAK